MFKRYIVVGILNTLVGYSIYAVLTFVFSSFSEYGYWFALVVGNLLSVLIAFLNQKHLVFKTQGNHVREFFRSCVVYGGTILYGLVLVPFLKEICGLDPYTAGAIYTLSAAFVGFWGHLRFTFRSNRDRDSRASAV